MGNEKVLFVGAHMDDELFILFRLLELSALGHEVHFIWLTTRIKRNGRDSRRKENENIMRFLKIPTKRRHYLEFPDGKTYILIKKIYIELNNAVKQINPAIIYLPGFEGGNIDHDVTNYVGHMIDQMHPGKYKLYEYHMYNNYSSNIKAISFKTGDFPAPNFDTITKSLSSQETKLKKRLIRFYRSQYLTIMFFAVFFNRKKNAFFFERYRPMPNHNYFSKPAGGVAYERYQRVRFSEYVQAIKSLAIDLWPDKRAHKADIEGFEDRWEDYNWWLQNYIYNTMPNHAR